MVRPLQQLTYLGLEHAPLINVRVAYGLRFMLPQLQELKLQSCEQLTHAAGDFIEQMQAEQRLVANVRQLLPGLKLEVCW